MKTQKPLLPLGGGKEMGRPQRKLLAICVGAAFMPCIAGVAWADSAVGVDTASGNALNPPGRVTIPYLSAADSYDTVRRSPTGQLYGIPYAQPDPEAERTINGWLYSGNFEFGFLGGSPDAKYSKFREYKDLKKGLNLNYFDFAANNPDTANFIQVFGGGIGQNDQFYSLQFGHYNDWRVRAFYNETPHVFSDTFKPIYLLNGNHEKLNPLYGTDAYTNVGITGANPFLTSPVTQSLPADQEVSLIRKKAGMRADWTPSKSWRFYVNTTYEKRDGERPFGFMAVEGVEPIDYKTSDLMAGIQYFQGKTAVNLRASLSIFQDDIKQLYVDSPLVEREVPYPVGALNQIYTFIYTPPPDNKMASIKGDILRRFDFWNSRFTGTVSWTTSRNNDSLRMPLNPGFLANDTAMAAGGTAADWNGVNGCPMSRCKSDLRVDSKLYLLGWTMDPTDDLTLRANARRYENDNKSPIFYAANPLLMGSPNATLYGVPFSGFFNTANAFGAPLNNLGAFTSAGPSYFSPPRSDTQTNYTLSGEYLFARKQALDLSYEREDFSHTYRERKETWEDKIKATYVNRGLFDDATLRTSWEVDKKRGSFYDPLVTTRPLASFMTLNGLPYSRDALKWMITNADTAAVLPSGIPVPTLAQMQTAILGNNGSGGQANGGDFMKIDQADRGQEVINTRLNWSVREDFDLGLSLQMKWIDYPHNNFGLQKNNQNSINLDANYQPSSSTQITAFYSRQKGKLRSIENYGYSNANNAAFSAATLLTYVQGICGPLSAGNIDCWLNNQRDPAADIQTGTRNTTNVLGVTAIRDFSWAKMELTYNYMRGNTKIDHQYWMNGGTALTAAQQATLAAVGDYPNMTTITQSVEFNVVKDINKRLSTRFMYRYENFRSQDWHYDYFGGVNALTTNFTAADMGPLNYHIHMFGLYLQYKL